MKNENDLLDMREISILTGIPTKIIRKTFIKLKIVEKVGEGKGGRWVTTISKIRNISEEVANIITKKLNYIKKK